MDSPSTSALRPARSPDGSPLATLDRTQALPSLPEVHRRDRAAALSGLAVAYAIDGDPDQATTALSALPVARRAGSARVVRAIADVSAMLEAHRSLATVRALADELAIGA